MKKIKRTLDIRALPQRVYDFLSLPSNLPGVWANLVSVSNPVATKGGAFDFDWNFKMVGFHFQGRSKVEDAQPGRLLRYRNEGGIPSTFIWALEGLDGSGTRLTVDVEYTIPTPVIGKIAEAIVAKINERDLDTMLANLKDVLESGAVGISATAH